MVQLAQRYAEQRCAEQEEVSAGLRLEVRELKKEMVSLLILCFSLLLQAHIVNDIAERKKY